MSTLITVVHIITCVLLVLVVLIQSGKGAEISASFAGSSQTVFGSSGGANFFTRFTSVAAAIFMLTSLSLTIIQNKGRKSLFEGAAPVTSTVPAGTAVPPAAPEQGQATSQQAPAGTTEAAKSAAPGAPAAPAQQ
jgi:preprotein translocase subunit SecG